MTVFLVLVLLFIPLLMIIIGAVMTIKPPKEVNPIVGYGTERARASPEAWQYSQRLFGKLSLVFNFLSLALSALVINLNWGILFEEQGNMSQVLIFSNHLLIMWTAQTIILCLAIPFVEHKLKKKFPEKSTL